MLWEGRGSRRVLNQIKIIIKQLPETWGHVNTQHRQVQWKGLFETKDQGSVCTNVVLDGAYR